MAIHRNFLPVIIMQRNIEGMSDV